MQRSTEQLTRYSTNSLEEELPDKTAENIVITQTVPRIMNICRSTIRWILLVDVLLALSVFILVGLLEFGCVPYQQIGFFCNDPKISFKYSGDTIPLGLLIGGSITVPVIMIWVAECICHTADSYNTAIGASCTRLKQVSVWYGNYMIGIIMLIFTLDVIKIFIGEPRPHFLDTCRPHEAKNCTNEYFDSYTCTNTIDTEWFVSDSSKSFPSGHSAVSMYTTVFLLCYLQNRLSNRTFLLKPWLQCAVCLWTIICSASRIGDHRHHWWDVLAGDVLGFIFGAFIVAIPCHKFHLGHSSFVQARSGPITNEQINFEEKKHKSIKRLLASPNVDISEGRELRDISVSWKE